jgi:hypothetical protein
MISLTLSLHLVTFPTIFIKLLDLEKNVLLIPELDAPIYKGIFSYICLLLSAPNFTIMIDPAQTAWSL